MLVFILSILWLISSPVAGTWAWVNQSRLHWTWWSWHLQTWHHFHQEMQSESVCRVHRCSVGWENPCVGSIGQPSRWKQVESHSPFCHSEDGLFWWWWHRGGYQWGGKLDPRSLIEIWWVCYYYHSKLISGAHKSTFRLYLPQSLRYTVYSMYTI